MLKNKNTLSLTFSVFALFNAVYLLAIFGQLISKNENLTLFFYQLKDFGALFLAPLFVLFLYRFSNYLKINTKYTLLLFVIPLLLLIASATNDYHHLFYKSVNVYSENGFMFIDNVRGPLFHVFSVYNILMFILSAYFLHLISLRKNYSFQRFSRVLTVYIVVSLIFNIIHIFKIIPYNINLIPLANLIGGFVYTFAIFYCNIFNVYELNFNLMPELSDGIIVTDENDEVIFFNAVAESFFPWFDETAIGKPFSSLPLLEYNLKNDVNDSSFILENTYANLTKYYLFKKIKLEHKFKYSAYAYVFEDHTESVYLQSRLERLATRDGLTNIYNQISILNKTKEHYNLAKENKKLFSITLIDVDNFKVVNDNYGHVFGNSVLIEIADSITTFFKSDCCNYGRFGGDEFLIVCSDCNKDIQKEKMDNLLKGISTIKYSESESVNLSISAGTYFIDFSVEGDYPTYEEALEFADRKMYESKDKKRQTK